MYAATSTVHDMFQSTRIYDSQINGGTGAVYFSTNSGAIFFVNAQLQRIPLFRVALDPSNANRMYASVLDGSTNIGGIYVTNNLSSGTYATWTKLAKPPRSNGHPFNITVLNNGDLVASFCARKPTSSTNFTDSSGVYYYDLATTTWSDRSVAGMYYWTKDVVVDPNDATQSTWYVAVFGGWANVPAGTGGIYKTTNKGVNWTQISNSFRVNSVTINPTNANELYYTTETRGLWYSSNATSTNPTFTQVTSYPFGGPTRVAYNPYKNSEIWVSSFGNGMMVGSTAPTTGIDKQVTSTDNQLKVYPNPNTGSFQVVFAGNSGQTATISVMNILGESVYETTALNNSNTPITINLSHLANGTYFMQMVNAEKVYTNKLIIDR